MLHLALVIVGMLKKYAMLTLRNGQIYLKEKKLFSFVARPSPVVL